jgi:hypothetical protein
MDNYIYIDGISDIEIPYVFSLEGQREVMGDENMTAGGILRFDGFNGTKRQYTLQCRAMEISKYRTITDYLDATLNKTQTVYMKHLGGKISALVRVENNTQISGTRGGNFSSELQEISILIKEV